MSTIDDLDESQLNTIDQIVELLRAEMRLFFITGAGMSADSGLPTYRGVGGLYNSGETEQGMSIEELLSGSTFRRSPDLTWKYLGEIGKACMGAKFNRGHAVISEMQDHFADVCVLTQNIDGFHLDAGSKNLIEIHGNLHNLRCDHCGFRKSVATFNEIDIPPGCDTCTKMMRPDVVLFDEMLLTGAIEHLGRQWDQGFDIVFSIGTTSVFPYIAEPVVFASRSGLPTIEINPTETTVTQFCDHRLPVSAAIALEEIWRRWRQQNVM